MSLRAVLLGRVSTSGRGQDAGSQIQALSAAAARHGWAVEEEVRVEASAWDPASNARVWQRAVAPFRAGRADVLMVWSLDRLTRGGVLDAFLRIRELEQHYGAAFYSLQEPFLSTATGSTAQRELLLSIMSWVAQQESTRRSERVRVKVESKRRNAANGGGRATWGGGKLATPEQIEAAEQLRADGEPIRCIAKTLGLSKSQVWRLVRGVPVEAPGHEDPPSRAGAATDGGGPGQAPGEASQA